MAAWLTLTACVLTASTLASGRAALPSGDCPASHTPPAVTAATPAKAPAHEHGPTLEKQAVYAIKFHADWCGHCAKLTPVYEAMVKEFEKHPVGFVKLNLTDKQQTGKSEQKMKELGLEEVWKQNKGRNGFILLVDAPTKNAIKTLNSSTTQEQAAEAIKAALNS